MDRILTTHAGSLPRPAMLTAAHAARFAGDGIDDRELADLSAQAARETVARQLDVGLDIVNNGEVGRESFFTYVQHRMSGFSGHARRPVMRDLTRYPGYLERMSRQSLDASNVSLLTPPMATAEVRYLDHTAINAECAELAALLRAHDRTPAAGFVSAPSPGIVAAAMENHYYPDLPSYVRAVAAALANEYRAITNAGFTLQIDAPDLAMERHTLFQDQPLNEFLEFVRVVIAATNDALAGIDPSRVRLHVCWGNYEGAHDCDVALAEIWPELTGAHVGGLMLSQANPRHAHEYQLFANDPLPPDVNLLAGVIDTTTNYVEHPEVVADRLQRVADSVGDPTRILASTDCGFETSAGFSAVADAIVWEKLKALVEGAAIASQRLFG